MTDQKIFTSSFDQQIWYIDKLSQQLDYLYSLAAIAINHNFSDYDHIILSNYWGAINVHVQQAKIICEQIAENYRQIEKSHQIVLSR